MASYLTNEDVQNFGYELLDVAQRAGLHALAPELQRLHDENQQLHDQLNATTKTAIDRELDAAVPNWREINADERFHQWLLQPEPYSGIIRDRFLKDAAHAAKPQRVISFFKGFLAAAGQTSAAPASHPRQRRSPSGQPAYSRGQITQMAAMRGKGQMGDAEWAKWEHELIRAGREGRILGALNADGIPVSR